jgi:SAM-dependent methyltransferase
MFADDPHAAVSEAVRVLRPDGGFAAMTWARRADNPWLGIVLDSVGEQFGMPFPPPGIAGPFSLDAPEELAGVLERAGLRDVVVSVADTPIPAASLEAWWERVPQLAGPLGAMLEAMDPETRDAIRDRAIANAASLARPVDGGISLGGSSLIAAGRR